MEYRQIGDSGLKVSEIGLGCNNFGGRAGDEVSVEIVRYALELGINFIDTAAMYSEGHSEELVGKAIKGKRSDIIIATKFGNPRSVGPSELPGSRSHIIRSVEESLKRLGTDYIDLFYLHYPDSETSIEETLRALDNLIRSGKVRYIACSNLSGWQLSEAIWTSKFNNLEPFVAIQSRYNLLDRHIEKDIIPCCQKHGLGVIPWGPLASGFLTGKYQRNKEIPTTTRLAKPFAIYRDVLTDSNYDKLEKMQTFASERGHSITELAIGWLLSHPWLGSVIAGAMSVDQLATNVTAATWKLTEHEMKELDDIK